MPVPDERASVVRRVQDLLDEGFLQLPGGSSAGAQDPLPVHGPDGRVHLWMVPFVADGKLVAWVQIGRALEFLRFSLLAGGNIKASPDAVDWLDQATVSSRIAKAAGTSHFLTPPQLTYDRDPSRLVWEAEVREAKGRSQRWFAAGTRAWPDTGAEEITGGPPRGN